MCLTLFVLFVEFLPYLCVVTVPVYGSFCGVDLILRVSILLYFYVIFSGYIPKILHHVIPYLNFSVFILIVIYIPVNLLPNPVVWLYDKLLWISEPFLLVAEIVLALNFIMHCSQRMMEKYEEDESPLWKAVMVCFSSGCYSITASMVWEIYTEGNRTQFWILFLVLVLCLTVHNMMWMSQEGILCDAAFAGLCSISVLYAMKEETALVLHPLSAPDSWYRYNRSLSLLSLARYIINSSVDNASLSLEFLMKFLRPFFLVTLGVRLYSILYIIEKVTKKLQPEDDEISLEELEEYEVSPWRSPITMKLAVVFMFTQMTVNLFYESRGISFSSFYPFSILEQYYPKDLVFGRIIQVLFVNVFYMYRLYYSEDWEWNTWFSSTPTYY